MPSNMVTLVTLTIVVYVSYFMLIQDNFLHTSIDNIIQNTHQLDPKTHLIVLGLLPIYIATVIFGSTIIGLYSGIAMQQILNRFCKREDV